MEEKILKEIMKECKINKRKGEEMLKVCLFYGCSYEEAKNIIKSFIRKWIEKIQYMTYNNVINLLLTEQNYPWQSVTWKSKKILTYQQKQHGSDKREKTSKTIDRFCQLSWKFKKKTRA